MTHGRTGPTSDDALLGHQREDARGARPDPARRRHRRHGADPRRERHRQGAGRARDPRGLARARQRPFVKVNCAALPSELLESELFGFERGAFTGAIQQKPGKFEFAQPRHDVPRRDQRDAAAAAVQAAAGAAGRRVRAARRTRTTCTSTCASSPRPTATSKRPSRTAQFREDLYFRLNVVCITLPPLRQRRDEIPALDRPVPRAVRRALQQAADRRSATRRCGCSSEYDWPGNVRELENLIKRAVVLGSDESLRRDSPTRSAARRRAAGSDSAAQTDRQRACRLRPRRHRAAPAPAPAASSAPPAPGSGVVERHRPAGGA